MLLVHLGSGLLTGAFIAVASLLMELSYGSALAASIAGSNGGVFASAVMMLRRRPPGSGEDDSALGYMEGDRGCEKGGY